MKTVFTSPSLVSVHQAKSLLEIAGIECVIQNETVSFLAGEVPYAATWPQVDVLKEKDFEKAKEVLNDLTGDEEPVGTIWECSECGEKHEPQFELCWNCGNERGESQ